MNNIIDRMHSYYPSNHDDSIHISCIFDNWKSTKNASNNFNYMTFGINSDRLRYKNEQYQTHAEMDVMRKFLSKMYKKRIKYKEVDMMVIKISKTGCITNSQPCYHCALEMANQKRIKIKNIFYSNDEGCIEKHKFNTWFKNTDHYVCKGWRYNNRCLKCNKN